MLALLALASVALTAQASVLPPREEKRNADGSDCSTGNWKWKNTDTVFSFGDSYTAESFNLTTFLAEGSSVLGPTSANGPNWIQDLTTIYNVSSPISRFNVAFSGATIDSGVIVPYSPVVQSVKDQVGIFEEYVQSGATWEQDKALCSVWIGINDIGLSYEWTNVSLSDFYQSEIDELHSLVNRVQSHSACGGWMFLTVPPLAATPLHAPVAATIGPLVDTWNTHTTLIESGEALGFTNVTGFNELYPIQYGVPQRGNNSQIEPYLPMSSYLWQDSLHPTWPVHNLLAHAIATWLGAVNVVGK